MSIEGYPSIGLAIAVAGAVLFFLWLPVERHRVHRKQRPRGPGASTMELRDEPAAIVAVLVDELDLDPDALGATVLDLAARRHLDIVQLSPTDHLVGPRVRPTDDLAPFELRVLEAVRAAAGDRPHATITELADVMRPGSAETWLQFRAEVHREAQRRGLIQTAGEECARPLMLLSLIPAVGLLVAFPMAYLLAPFLYVGLLVAGIFLVVIGRGFVLTHAGQEAAAHWLGVRAFIADHDGFGELPAGAVAVWDRYLAYGAAMGLSDEAVRTIVEELRTTVSAADVGRLGKELRVAVGAQHDPVQAAVWRGEQLRAQFGPDASSDDVFGPGSGDLWALLQRTGGIWTFAQVTFRADRPLWCTAARARIHALAAAAPPELAADVGVVAAAALVAVDRLEVATDRSAVAELGRDAAIAAPEVLAARDRLVAAVAAHCGIEPTGGAVAESLTGVRSPFEGLFA